MRWDMWKVINSIFEKYGFISNLSIIDLLFNVGPETLKYLT